MIRPFRDQANQLLPVDSPSRPLRTRMILGGSVWVSFATLQMRRSPPEVCVASISDLCFETDPCQARPVIGEGVLVGDKVCRMQKMGWSMATRIEPFRYLEKVLVQYRGKADVAHPIANVFESDAGAKAVTGSTIVLAEVCSAVEGSNKMTLPCEFPRII